MNTIPVSVYIITLNEAANLRRLLPQLAEFDDIVVVDSGSKDTTEAVARSFANVRFYYREWTGFGDQKQYALTLCRNEWVLNLDADEEPTPEYLTVMKQTVAANDCDALRSRRILLRWGRKPRDFMKEDLLIRLFRKNCGHYLPVKVHERIHIDGRIKHTTAALLHFENLTFTQRMHKSNQYSQLKAQDKFAKGHRSTWLHLVFAFPVGFLQCYFGKGCFLDGADGLLTSMNFAYYTFMKYAKLWELQQHRRAPTPPVGTPPANPPQPPTKNSSERRYSPV
ncbi:MAG TPA: glycosyltransferase family 2 protein [Candidatus Acidoferrum sp.]|nr:glycosyltransferase family 2 protein [Candidatus Acidoferrum sp.]